MGTWEVSFNQFGHGLWIHLSATIKILPTDLDNFIVFWDLTSAWLPVGLFAVRYRLPALFFCLVCFIIHHAVTLASRALDEYKAVQPWNNGVYCSYFQGTVSRDLAFARTWRGRIIICDAEKDHREFCRELDSNWTDGILIYRDRLTRQVWAVGEQGKDHNERNNLWWLWKLTTTSEIFYLF